MKTIIVVDNKDDLPDSPFELVSARSYLTNPHYSDNRRTQVLNLCRHYRYQSFGYYVSLLAAARGHKVIPEVIHIQDFKSIKVLRQMTQKLHGTIQKGLADIGSESFQLSVYFGQNLAHRHEKLARELFAILKMPLFRVQFEKRNNERASNKHSESTSDKNPDQNSNKNNWIITGISALNLKDIPESHKPYIPKFISDYVSQKKRYTSSKPQSRYDLAILINPDEASGPSDQKAIDRFIRAGEKIGFQTEIIFPEEMNRLAEFDALFIRETTAVNHHTYRFARLAEAMGLIVIDDPTSILKCTNKVFLAELLNQNGIATPKTYIVHRDNYNQLREQIQFPIVIKKPDSSFSVGVIKANDSDEWKENLQRMFEKSDLLLAQEFMPTEFDWRIGIIDQQPLFACRYFMARGHWQVYDWNQTGKNWGKTETLPIYQVPNYIIETALQAANLIGNGLYGVDLKEVNGKAYIIEINDNPNIDSGNEDEYLKDELYMTIMQSFLQRIENKKKGIS